MSKETTTAVKRGRPTVAGSKRQAVLAMREAKRAAGLEIKRGRPKMVKDETTKVKAKTPKAKLSKADKQAKLATKSIVVVDANPELTHESLQVL